MKTIDHRRLASELIPAAHEAGRRIMAHYGRAEVELKTDHSPVTAADREADAVLIAALADAAPGVAVVSEESSPTADTGAGEPFFLVDPLDGTKEFIKKRAEFTVNVALVENAEPCFGLVYAPAVAKLYVTLAQDEAVRVALDPEAPMPALSDLDMKPIRTRAPASGGMVAVVSRSHMDADTEAFLERHGIADTCASGSSLKFCRLAEGRADVYPRFGRTMEWDIAAGHAVLAAAGGVVLDEAGAPLRYGKAEAQYANPGFVAWGRAPAETL